MKLKKKRFQLTVHASKGSQEYISFKLLILKGSLSFVLILLFNIEYNTE